MKHLVHPLTNRQLEAALRERAGGYIFHGARSVGKALAARELARRFNCQGDELRSCIACRQFDAGNYPDFIEVRPEGRVSVTIDQVRQVNHALALSSYYAQGIRMVVIDEAHMLTPEAQNALLKVIEEPPPRTLFVLVAEHLEALLPTVCSRLAPIYFAPLPREHVADWLMAEHGVAPAEAARVADLSAGAPGLALQLIQDEGTIATFEQLDKAARIALSAGLFERLVLAKQLAEAKVDLTVLAGRLQRALVTRLQQTTAASAQVSYSLVALEQFRRALAGNVNARVALERLMLEL